jgi:dolichyl-phosphate beta-glucosyltransferase
VIPCYNEANRIQQPMFAQALLDDESLAFIFVNDGSSDDTFRFLCNFRDALSTPLKERILILSYKTNKGKSNAVREGFNYIYSAISNGANDGSINETETNSVNETEIYGDHSLFREQIVSTAFVGFWDADLATPLEEVKWFYQFAGDDSYDLIIGSRVARLGAKIDRTIFRHYSGRLFATLISQGLGWKVHDTQCGAKLMKPELIPICMERPFKTSWLFDVEILLRLKKVYGNAAQEKVLEVPIRAWNDVKGSKIGWLDFVKVPFQIWKVFQYYK